MLKGDISNLPSLTVAVDLDSILDGPQSKWMNRALRFVSRWPRLAWNAKPLLLNFCRLNRDAEIFSYWLLEKDISIIVVVRAPQNLLTRRVVARILGEDEPGGYPNVGYFSVPVRDVKLQADQINYHCSHQLFAHRFYTNDKDLANRLPPRLTFYFERWEDVHSL